MSGETVKRCLRLRREPKIARRGRSWSNPLGYQTCLGRVALGRVVAGRSKRKMGTLRPNAATRQEQFGVCGNEEPVDHLVSKQQLTWSGEWQGRLLGTDLSPPGETQKRCYVDMILFLVGRE